MGCAENPKSNTRESPRSGQRSCEHTVTHGDEMNANPKAAIML